jgi:hypothetical protein
MVFWVQEINSCHTGKCNLVHSDIHPQHASSVATVLATTQLTMMQTTSNADNDADVNTDNDNARQTMDDDAGDGQRHK